jgi:hypothetical protein
MKLTKSLLLVTMLAGVAVAQVPSTPNAVAAQLKKAGAPTTSVAPQATPKTAVPAKPGASAPAKPTLPATKPEHVGAKSHVVVKHTMTKPAAMTHVAKKPAATPKSDSAEKPAAPASDATAEVAPEIKRGRDPFVSVIQERSGNFACAGSGKKCLIVDQVMLKGVVRSQGESIAVVSSTANKTYFLRENDPVYNGVVVKITPDSIVFRESVTDRLGKTVQREVVKKVNNPAV